VRTDTDSGPLYTESVPVYFHRSVPVQPYS